MALTQIQQAMLADGILTADAAGRLKMADGFVNDAKISGVAASKVSGQLVDDNMSPGSIIQVIQAFKTDTQTIANGAGNILITGLSVSITPLRTSSRILALWSVNVGADNNEPSLILYRNGSPSGFIGDAAGSRSRGSTAVPYIGTPYIVTQSGAYIDSPATTSATTYAIYGQAVSGSGSILINRSSDDTDGPSRLRGASSLILLEVAG